MKKLNSIKVLQSLLVSIALFSLAGAHADTADDVAALVRPTGTPKKPATTTPPPVPAKQTATPSTVAPPSAPAKTVEEDYADAKKYDGKVKDLATKLDGIKSKLNSNDVVEFQFETSQESDIKTTSGCSDEDTKFIKSLAAKPVKGKIQRQIGKKFPAVLELTSPVETNDHGVVDMQSNDPKKLAAGALGKLTSAVLAGADEVAYFVFISQIIKPTPVTGGGYRLTSEAQFSQPEIRYFAHANKDGSDAKCVIKQTIVPSVVSAGFKNAGPASTPPSTPVLTSDGGTPDGGTPPATPATTDEQKKADEAKKAADDAAAKKAADDAAAKKAADDAAAKKAADDAAAKKAADDAAKTKAAAASTPPPPPPKKAPGKSVFGCSVQGDSSLMLLASLCFLTLLHRRKRAYKRVS